MTFIRFDTRIHITATLCTAWVPPSPRVRSRQACYLLYLNTPRPSLLNDVVVGGIHDGRAIVSSTFGPEPRV